MGLYNNIEENLPKQFSIFQLMAILGINASEVRLARNLLKQFYQAGYIKRIGKNMYQKLEQPEKSQKKEPKKISKGKKTSMKSEAEVIPLTELHGLGPKTEERFTKIGIKSVNDLIKEDPSELAPLIKGSSESSIKDWIEEGKRLFQ
jgi:DNA polymerase/3'-5' exonuclease PolX